MARLFNDLDSGELQHVCEFLLGKRCYLFLGSGVSMDSEGHLGLMSSANKLRKELIGLNSLPEGTSLQQAYSMLTDDQKKERLTEHYHCVTVGATADRIASHPWRRIYTLNIDNCIETAFRNLLNDREFGIESLESFNYCDGYSELLSEKRCSIVHLHGTVERPSDGYVFSRNEYAKSMSRPNSWMLTLSQLIRAEMFVVAGTSLDEIDVDYYLEQRSQNTKRGDVPPSILIEPYPTILTEKLCEDHEFVLFKGTVLEFFGELEQIDMRFSQPWTDNENDGLVGLGLSKGDRLRFSATFETVPDDPGKTPNPARFLLGADLTWSMLAANTDLPRDVFSDIRSVISSIISDPEFRVLMLIDAPGSGKTSFLKRLAYDFSHSLVSVFWFSGLGIELSAKEIGDILDSIRGPVIVFVDNFADALNSVSLILESVSKADIVFVCSERDYRLPYIENAFNGQDYQIIKDFLGLTRAEAFALRNVHEQEGLSTIRSLKDHIFLGQVVGKSISEGVCRIQNNFKTLDDIVQSLSAECGDSENASYLLVALARYCYSMGVRRSVLSTISHPEDVEFLFSESSALPIKFSDNNTSFVVPKHGIIGDRILESNRHEADKKLLNAFIDLANSVAPRVNPRAISRKTPESQLLGRLMDYDNNVKRFVDSHAEEYYAALKPLCEWNARYWEQMSLLKLDRYFASPDDHLLLEESIQHARSAISAELHPFSLTTLAKVLFQAMEKSPERKQTLFQEAWNNVVEADSRESRWASRGATLFVVCFGGVLRFLELGGQLTGEQSERLRNMIDVTYKMKMRDRRLGQIRKELQDAL